MRRRILSLGLLLAVAVGGPAALWMWSEPLEERLLGWWSGEEEVWNESPAVRVTVELSGSTLPGIQTVARKMISFLAPFDGQIRHTVTDTPAPGAVLSATLPPPAVLPLQDLSQKIVDGWNASIPAVRPEKRIGGKKRKRRLSGRPAARPDPAEKVFRDIQRRKKALDWQWAETEKSHQRLMDARNQFRHPEDLVRRDAEAVMLKSKLVDMEITLAEVIDHYTPEHPRVRQIQNDMMAIRTELDRRILAVDQEEQSKWTARVAEYRRQKRSLEKEERNAPRRAMIPAPSAEPAVTEPAAETEGAEGVVPQTPPGILKMSWSESPTVLKSLTRVKKIDSQKLSMVFAGVGGLFVGIGYCLGCLGSAAGSAPIAEGAAAVEAEDPYPKPAGPAAVKPSRRPLPPMSESPPPAPEKILPESEMPGQPWIEIPMLPEVEKGLYTVFAPTSPAAALFATTAERLLKEFPDAGAQAAESPQVVAVAAIRSGTGTSTFVANLAVALSAHRPVVLVDLHHTAPQLHNLFSIKSTSQDLTASGSWADSIQATPIDRLSVLPLFYPHQEKEMADLKLKKRFAVFLKESAPDRLVLLDVAPVGRSDVFEEIADVCHRFLLIVGPDPTPAGDRSVLRRLAKVLKKKPILRVVRHHEPLPQALTARPSRQYEFIGVPG